MPRFIAIPFHVLSVPPFHSCNKADVYLKLSLYNALHELEFNAGDVNSMLHELEVNAGARYSTFNLYNGVREIRGLIDLRGVNQTV